MQAPEGALFSEHAIYTKGLLDEFSINAYWAGHYDESLDACLKLLGSGKLEVAESARIVTNADFARKKLAVTEKSNISHNKYYISGWAPSASQGGTELMFRGLTQRLNVALRHIDLKLNMFSTADLTGKPLVVWFHHNTDQKSVQWCNEAELVRRIHRFVFVTYWQMHKHLNTFNLPRERCVELRNAINVSSNLRKWRTKNKLRIAYTSTPFRGLDVLLGAWEVLQADNVELHIWSSMRLYGRSMDEKSYEWLFAKARSLPNVYYHNIVPNEELLEELRNIDFLVYPSTFEETSCLSVIEAMSAGCRVICPLLGALPETSAGFARHYPVQVDHVSHVEKLVQILSDEIAKPWQGVTRNSVAQQLYCASVYDWTARELEWRDFLCECTLIKT